MLRSRVLPSLKHSFSMLRPTAVPFDDTLSAVFPWASGDAPFIPAGVGSSNVHKALPDPREYRFTKLRNGLRALLISDPKCEKGAAALTVGVGHLADPRELPGLSHFLEHMLFLGTTAFPDEAAYKKFLADHGGGSNASTSAETTTYHFYVHHDHLGDALARFCAFFTCPLFTESATDRELSAVDNENSRNLSIDSRREFQISKHVSAADSVWRKFGTGNMKTLRPDGVDVRAALLAHYDRFYSANIMTLGVIGRESLDDLEATITGARVASCGIPSDFSAIVDRDIPIPLHDDALVHLHPYQRAQLARSFFITPVKDSRTLTLTWPVPSLAPSNFAGVGRILSHLFGHEGEGSILSLLKARAWASSVSASENANRSFTNFSIQIDLTERGLERSDEVVQVVLQFAALLRVQDDSAFTEVHAEISQVSSNSTRFRQEVPPDTVAQNAAALLQTVPGVDVLVAHLLPVTSFDVALVRSALACICSPRNMMLKLTAKLFGMETGKEALVAKHAETLATATEPYYVFDYMSAPFTAAQLGLWGAGGLAASNSSIVRADGNDWELTATSLPLCPELRIPAPNRFIPSDFTLKCPVAEVAAVGGSGSQPAPPSALSLAPHRLDLGGLSFSCALDYTLRDSFREPALLTKGAPPDIPTRAKSAAAAVMERINELRRLGSAHLSEPAAAEYERALHADGGLPTRIWHADGKFRYPRSFFRARVRLPRHKVLCAAAGCMDRAIAPLFNAMLQDIFTEQSYSASIAGLHCNVDCDVDDNFLGINVYGYSHKLVELLVAQIVQLTSLTSASDEKLQAIFTRLLDERRRAFLNFRKAQPIDRAQAELSEHLHHPKPSYESWLRDLEDVSVDDVRNFADGLFDSQVEDGGENLGASVELLLYGNATVEDALFIGRLVSLALGRSGTRRTRAELSAMADTARVRNDERALALGVPSGLLGGRFPESQQLLLPVGSDVVITRAHPAESEKNAAVVVQYQVGVSTPRNRALTAFLGQLVSAPFFESLRTKEQLGYVVSAGASIGAVASLTFRVQTNNSSIEHVYSRIEAFIADFRGQLAAMKDDELLEKARIRRDRLLEPDKTQQSECSRMWDAVEAGALEWHALEANVAPLEHIRVADLLRVWDERIASGGPLVRRATSRVHAPVEAGLSTSAVPPLAANEVANALLFKVSQPDEGWLPSSHWVARI